MPEITKDDAPQRHQIPHEEMFQDLAVDDEDYDPSLESEEEDDAEKDLPAKAEG